MFVDFLCRLRRKNIRYVRTNVGQLTFRVRRMWRWRSVSGYTGYRTMQLCQIIFELQVSHVAIRLIRRARLCLSIGHCCGRDSSKTRMSRFLSHSVTLLNQTMLALSALRSCTRSQSWLLCSRWKRYASTSGGHNAAIVEMLKKGEPDFLSLGVTRKHSTIERDAYSEQPDPNGYKIRAFSNAIKVIEGFDRPIYSSLEALTVRNDSPWPCR